MKPEIRVFSTLDALNTAAAAHFSEKVIQAVKKRRLAHVVLSGGSTPLGLFKLLAKAPYLTGVPWQSVHVYWADERCVPPDDPESNYGQARQILLDKVPVMEGNIHRIHGEMAPEHAAVDYAAQLAESARGIKRWPEFDWVMLGMGADGHTASLFPGQVHSKENASPVIAVTANYLGRPARRVSLTPLVINNARNVLFMVAGEDKAQMAALVIKGPRDPIRFPAQRIQPLSGTTTWMLDALAGKALR
jgi:6-phosphogluconolactonase